MVVVTGLVPAVVFLTGAGSDALSLNPSVTPLMWPTLPTLSGLAILFAALAGLVAPPPERPALLASRTMRADDERGRRTPISDSSPPVEVSA
jgi:energy-coupling factor transport system permease protein